MSTLTLLVDGTRYEGWKAVTVTRGIEQLAGAFEVTCADRWAIAKPAQPLPVLRGKTCTVLIDDQVVITGFIDAAPPRYSARGHELIVRGRDATGDLVDSSATTDGGGWQNRSLKAIATDLCKPFGIRVSVDAAVARDAAQPFLYQHLQLGETCQAALTRLARIRGCLLVSDSAGGLLITRAGSARAATALVLGENILSADAEDSCAERFHSYRVIAQDRQSDYNDGETAQQVLGTAIDRDVRAGRLLIIDAQDATDAGGAAQLAAWTSATRAAAGQRVRYTVRGWLDGARPWQPNTLVSVRDPWARFDGDYLIATVTYTLDTQGGEITQLDVVPRDAYKPLKLREVDPAEAGLQ
ncbi:phage baseplate assembly protein [Solimonas flava]|uniref:phage baseplate assembly protein n=1 Tax=Solimonas flava TaxID=415849 RepID=UPI0005BB2A8F|nr:contractile injection system protein, VgrG/Pvc8 family [Solimonas flava]